MGYFFVNFDWKLGPFKPCRQMWCGQCYTSDPKLNFHIKTLQGDQKMEEKLSKNETERLNLAWVKNHRNKDNFKVDRDWDHAMILFEYDTYIQEIQEVRSGIRQSTRLTVDGLYQKSEFRCNVE